VEPLWLSCEGKENKRNKPKIPGSLPCPVLHIIVVGAGIYWMVEHRQKALHDSKCEPFLKHFSIILESRFCDKNDDLVLFRGAATNDVRALRRGQQK
jgi:hypothetical protein